MTAMSRTEIDHDGRQRADMYGNVDDQALVVPAGQRRNQDQMGAGN